jgi:SulP family sulfate permease
VRALLERSGYLPVLGEENLFPVRHRVLAASYLPLDSTICKHCRAHIFSECHERLPDGTPPEQHRLNGAN